MRPLTPAEQEVLRKQLSLLRPEVAAFALAMEDKLRQNDHKGGWDDCSKQYLAMRLTQEREELRSAIARGDPPEDIMKEAADIANFAMMVADLCGGLQRVVLAPHERPVYRRASYVEKNAGVKTTPWKRLPIAVRIAVRYETRQSDHLLDDDIWTCVEP